MSRFTRLLAALRPASVPPHLQARCLAAMEGRTMTPAVGAWGSASAAGDSSAATGLDPTPPAVADPSPEGEGPVPTSDHHATSSRTPPTPSGPPTCETDLFWEPASPDAAFDLSTGRLAHLLDRWKGTPA